MNENRNEPPWLVQVQHVRDGKKETRFVGPEAPALERYEQLKKMLGRGAIWLVDPSGRFVRYVDSTCKRRAVRRNKR